MFLLFFLFHYIPYSLGQYFVVLLWRFCNTGWSYHFFYFFFVSTFMLLFVCFVCSFVPISYWSSLLLNIFVVMLYSVSLFLFSIPWNGFLYQFVSFSSFVHGNHCSDYLRDFTRAFLCPIFFKDSLKKFIQKQIFTSAVIHQHISFKISLTYTKTVIWVIPVVVVTNFCTVFDYYKFNGFPRFCCSCLCIWSICCGMYWQ